MGDSSDEETIVDQFKPELLSLDSLNYLVIDLKELDIKKPVAPDAKLYHSVWNTSTEQKTVAVKLLGKVNEREVSVFNESVLANLLRHMPVHKIHVLLRYMPVCACVDSLASHALRSWRKAPFLVEAG